MPFRQLFQEYMLTECILYFCAQMMEKVESRVTYFVSNDLLQKSAEFLFTPLVPEGGMEMMGWRENYVGTMRKIFDRKK